MTMVYNTFLLVCIYYKLHVGIYKYGNKRNFIPTFVRMKTKVVRDLIPCSLVIGYPAFTETLGPFYQNTHHHTSDNHVTELHRQSTRSVRYS